MKNVLSRRFRVEYDNGRANQVLAVRRKTLYGSFDNKNGVSAVAHGCCYTQPFEIAKRCSR